MANKPSGLSTILKRFISRIPDVKHLILSTNDGIELLTESRSDIQLSPEDSQVISLMIHANSNSKDQITRLGMGSYKYTISSISSGIMVHATINSFVVSIFLDEGSNVGLVVERLELLQELLAPFCVSFDQTHVHV